MSHGRYYIAPLRVSAEINTSTNSDVPKKPPRKPSKPIKIDMSNSQNRIRDHIYYATLSQYGGYGAAARAWAGTNNQYVGIN